MLIAIAALFLFIVIFAYLYIFRIEPRKLRIVRHEIESPLVPASFDGTRIVHFSDTHVGPHYSLERLGKLADAVNQLKPDIVAFTGDLHDARRRDNLARFDPAPALGRIRAPLGKYAVYGNHDFGYSRTMRSAGSFLSRAGFTVLVNASVRVTREDGARIVVAGLDDAVVGKPNARSTFDGREDDSFHLLLAHEPDVADGLTRYPVDLQLSGHSHGGQISLPIFGPIVRTSLGRKYVKGLYRIDERRRAERPYVLYVNCGIGTTWFPARLGNVPEIAVFTLRSGERSASPR